MAARNPARLATGLGVIAAHHGHRVLSGTAVDWVARLTDAHRLGRLGAELARMRRCGRIVIEAGHPSEGPHGGTRGRGRAGRR